MKMDFIVKDQRTSNSSEKDSSFSIITFETGHNLCHGISI